MSDDASISINVAGELFDRIVITSIGPASCGHINDGVSFYLHNNHKRTQDAGGVMSFADLEVAYIMIKESRRIRAEAQPKPAGLRLVEADQTGSVDKP